MRKKKKNEKNFDEKELMYLADLISKLPVAYLAGVWEIVEEKPFLESSEKQLNFDLSMLKTKKIREI